MQSPVPGQPSRRKAIAAILAGATFCTLAGQSAAALSDAPTLRPLPPLPPLPEMTRSGFVERGDARIWYGRMGAGRPVVLLHGGMASSRSWAHQVPALIKAGFEIILVDSRGHGRSSLGSEPLSYALLADDTVALATKLDLHKPVLAGWSDGAIVALLLAMRGGRGLGGVFAFGANMDHKGVRPNADDAPILGVVGPRLMQDYLELSPAPSAFATLRDAVRAMQKAQPDTSREQLAAISKVDVAIAAGAQDEFITAQHPVYLAENIPGAHLLLYPGTGHFAPWERPELFNRTLLGFLAAGEPAPWAAVPPPHFF